MEPIISIIVAMSRNNVIGVNNDMPWKQKADLKHFQNLTKNKVIIMGRKTFESIGKKLPNRTNVVITRDESFSGLHEVECFSNLNEALEHYEKESEIMIIGGGQIYKEAMPYANNFYITYIETEINNGEVFFPELDKTLKKITEVKHFKDENNQYDYTFVRFEK